MSRGALGDTARALLVLEPDSRMLVRVAAARPGLLGYSTMAPILTNAPGDRGPFSLVQTPLDTALLEYLQQDAAWGELVGKHEAAPTDGIPHGCECEKQLGLKAEIFGHIGPEPPECARLHHNDVSSPLPAPRVRAFVRAFVVKNSVRLLRLQALVRAGLAALPDKYLGENGRHFLQTDIQLTAFYYGMLQIMEAKERLDPAHYDGGASWLHAGLTVWGRRSLAWKFLDGRTLPGQTPLPAEALQGLRTEHGPGDFYVGNVVSSRHQVVHLAPAAAEPLFRRAPADKGYHITCMSRCDAFRGSQARGQGIPSPTEVYDVVNKVTADFLADGPRWETPSLADTHTPGGAGIGAGAGCTGGAAAEFC